MKRKSAVFVVWAMSAAAVLIAVSPTAAQTFYREEFNAMDGGVDDDTLPFHGWDNTHIGTFDPTDGTNNSAGVVPGAAIGDGFHWWYNATPLQDPIVTVTEASVTAAGEVTPFTPVTDTAITWGLRVLNYQYPGFNDADSGIPTQMRPAVQMENGNWYAAAQPILTPDVPAPNGEGSEFTQYSIPFSYAAADWLNLTLNTLVPMMPTPQGATIGGAPASDLSGQVIGIGWAMTFSQRSAIHLSFIEIGVPPVPGDTDNDGDVDVEDFNTIRGNFGMTGATRADGDLTGPGSGGQPDGVVDLYDFGQWKDNFPFPGSGGGSVGSQSIPEPASAVLMTMTLVSVLSARRMRPRQQSHVT